MATVTAAARRYSGLSIWPEPVRGTLFPLVLTLLVLGLVAAPVVVLVVAIDIQVCFWKATRPV